MFAVIELVGHQFRVEKDMVFLSELTGNEAGSEFVCNDVLLIADGDKSKVGKPKVSGATVKLKVIEDLRGKKIHGFRYRRRKGTHRTWGHRQDLQRLQVVDIKG